jgi:hypothetical protein
MPQIEIVGPKAEDGKPMAGWGTRLLVDGKELADVRSIRMEIDLERPVTVHAEVLATTQARFSGAADLHVHIVALPGYQIVALPQDDGSTVYRCERTVESA